MEKSKTPPTKNQLIARNILLFLVAPILLICFSIKDQSLKNAIPLVKNINYTFFYIPCTLFALISTIRFFKLRKKIKLSIPEFILGILNIAILAFPALELIISFIIFFIFNIIGIITK